MSGVKQTLDWVYTFSKSTPSERRRMKALLLKGIKEFENGQGKEAFNLLESANCDFIGFVPGIQYFKESGPVDDVKAMFVHPFGGPTLLYKHKKLPVLFLASPSLRYNDSYLLDRRANEFDGQILGITD